MWGSAVALILMLTASVQAGLTAGAIVDLDAANNPGAVQTQWTNVGTLGGYYDYTPPIGGSTKPNLTADTVTYYTASSGATWGTTPPGANNPAITGIKSFSIEMWLRKSGPALNTEHQLMGLNSTDFSQYIQVFFRKSNGDSDANLDVDIKGKNSGTQHFTDLGGASGAVSSNTWTQLVLVLSDSAQTLGIYKDGALAGTVSVSQSFDTATLMSELTLFKTHPDEQNSRIFNGDFSRFRLYDFALSSGQVGDNFSFGNTPVPEPTAGALALVIGSASLARRKRRR